MDFYLVRIGPVAGIKAAKYGKTIILSNVKTTKMEFSHINTSYQAVSLSWPASTDSRKDIYGYISKKNSQ